MLWAPWLANSWAATPLGSDFPYGAGTLKLKKAAPVPDAGAADKAPAPAPEKEKEKEQPLKVKEGKATEQEQKPKPAAKGSDGAAAGNSDCTLQVDEGGKVQAFTDCRRVKLGATQMHLMWSYTPDADQPAVSGRRA